MPFFYKRYPHQPFIVQVLRGVVCVLLGYKVRVLSYASGAFPCIVRVGVFGPAHCFAPCSSWRLGCGPCYQGPLPYSTVHGGPMGFPIDRDEQLLCHENFSDIIQSLFIPKKEDPGRPTIECPIGPHNFDNALCDLGSSINIMPKVIYDALYGGPLSL